MLASFGDSPQAKSLRLPAGMKHTILFAINILFQDDWPPLRSSPQALFWEDGI